MSASIRQRKALHLVTDTRTAGQRRATERDWSSTPAEPVVKIYKPEADDLRAINRLIGILILALFAGAAWAWFTQTGQLLLEVVRSAK